MSKPIQKIKVVGAGMAGLLAGCLLRDQLRDIEETSSSVPNNHTAVLRFRSGIVGEALGIQFKQVPVIKSIVSPCNDTIWNNVQYSRKVTGEARMRSLSSVSPGSEMRYIAPPDFISRMAGMIHRDYFKFNSTWSPELGRLADAGERFPVISTIPMNTLMTFLDYPWADRVHFRYRSAFNLRWQVEGVELYCSQYYPGLDLPISRVSVTGDEVIAELQMDKVPTQEHVDEFVELAMAALGLSDMKIVDDSIACYPQKYAKIIEINDYERRKFIMWASREYNIFSLGRFATWRPKLLLDDIVNDVRVIQRLVNTGDSYNYAKAMH